MRLHFSFLFYSHLLQQTTWVDPRKANFNASHTTQISPHPPTQSSPHSPNVSMQNLQQSLQNIPLPGGWEQASTPEGEIYYINHVDRTTTWFDPRLRKSRNLTIKTLKTETKSASCMIIPSAFMPRVYSFRLSIRMFVRSYVRLGEIFSQSCRKVSQVGYVSRTTHQKAFIFGP